MVVGSAVKRIDNSTNWSAACPLCRFLLTSPFRLLVTRGKQHHLLLFYLTIQLQFEFLCKDSFCILDQSWTTQTLFALPHFVAVGRQFRILTTTTTAQASHHYVVVDHKTLPVPSRRERSKVSCGSLTSSLIVGGVEQQIKATFRFVQFPRI